MTKKLTSRIFISVCLNLDIPISCPYLQTLFISFSTNFYYIFLSQHLLTFSSHPRHSTTLPNSFSFSFLLPFFLSLSLCPLSTSIYLLPISFHSLFLSASSFLLCPSLLVFFCSQHKDQKPVFRFPCRADDRELFKPSCRVGAARRIEKRRRRRHRQQRRSVHVVFPFLPLPTPTHTHTHTHARTHRHATKRIQTRTPGEYY